MLQFVIMSLPKPMNMAEKKCWSVYQAQLKFENPSVRLNLTTASRYQPLQYNAMATFTAATSQ